jgi:hypothetical protein
MDGLRFVVTNEAQSTELQEVLIDVLGCKWYCGESYSIHISPAPFCIYVNDDVLTYDLLSSQVGEGFYEDVNTNEFINKYKRLQDEKKYAV